ncbi:hypothetical protein Hanom_Chr09g00852391 [Helianthus anomalus]
MVRVAMRMVVRLVMELREMGGRREGGRELVNGVGYRPQVGFIVWNSKQPGVG